MTHLESDSCRIHNFRLDDHFTTTYNCTWADERLSFKAKGVLIYILSRPPNWSIHTWQLAALYKGDDRGNGIESIKSVMKELKEFGYIVYSKTRDEKGQWVHRYDAYPLPFEEIKKLYPQVVKPSTVNRKTVKAPIIINNELINTELNTSKEDIAPTAKRQSYDIVFSFESNEFEGITPKDLANWKQLYPTVNIDLELKRMAEWCLANQSKSKTKKKWRRFINTWLSENNEKNINKEAYKQGKNSSHVQVDQQDVNKSLAEKYEKSFVSGTAKIEVLSKHTEIVPRGHGQPICINYSELGFKEQLESAMRKFGFKKLQGKHD